MCLTAGESETTYEAHRSRPAGRRKETRAVSIHRDLAAPFKKLFPNASRQITVSLLREGITGHKKADE